MSQWWRSDPEGLWDDREAEEGRFAVGWSLCTDRLTKSLVWCKFVWMSQVLTILPHIYLSSSQSWASRIFSFLPLYMTDCRSFCLCYSSAFHHFASGFMNRKQTLNTDTCVPGVFGRVMCIIDVWMKNISDMVFKRLSRLKSFFCFKMKNLLQSENSLSLRFFLTPLTHWLFFIECLKLMVRL